VNPADSPTVHPRDVLRDRTIAIQREIVGMTMKQARLARAISDRKTALARLEASAVLGAMVPARRSHE